MIDLWNSLCWK